MHTSETWLKQLVYRMVLRTLGTLLLLPTGTIYRGTPKQYSIVRVQKNYSEVLFLHEKSGNVLPACSAAFIPMPEGRSLSPRVGKAMKRFWNWLTHRVDDPPGDDYYFCGMCDYVLISDPCSHLK